jgi:hypothetical protein
MRTAPLCLAASLTALLLPLPLGAAQADPPCLLLAELEADPDTTRGEREFVELWNCGASAIALGGWKVRDAPTTSGSTNTFTFPAWSLAAGGRVVVWNGGSADGRGPAWSNPTVWNNAGDAATLIDPDGRIADWLGYGTTAAPPPEFANRTAQPRPAQGQSVQLDRGAWVLAQPTPGTALGATGGTLQVEVSNLPPTGAFADPPRSARPGATVTLRLRASDPNGDADVATWTLQSANATLASGSGGGDLAATVTAPRAGTQWEVRLTVTDQAGLSAGATLTLPLRWSDLVVEMPAGAPRIPAAAPGTAGLVAQGNVTVRNLGAAAVSPRIDVSAFAGPATFPAEGHLAIGWTAGNVTTWTEYAGPLTALPSLAPEATATLSFKVTLPSPLPAGVYGTSFAVVP